jgi:hypothetical protein
MMKGQVKSIVLERRPEGNQGKIGETTEGNAVAHDTLFTPQ